MTKHTHVLSGIVFIEGVMLYHGISLNHLMAPEVLSFILPYFGASLLGAIFPDVDMQVSSIIKHRTLTHWPIFYLFGIIISYYYSIPYLTTFCMACLVHLALDFFTMMGIPLFHPFGKRYGLRWVNVGRKKELIVFALLSLTGAYLYTLLNS